MKTSAPARGHSEGARAAPALPRHHPATKESSRRGQVTRPQPDPALRMCLHSGERPRAHGARFPRSPPWILHGQDLCGGSLNRRKAAPCPELAQGTPPPKLGERSPAVARNEQIGRRGRGPPSRSDGPGEVPARFIQRGARTAERLRMTSSPKGSFHHLPRTTARARNYEPVSASSARRSRSAPVRRKTVHSSMARAPRER
jgi:hypothetical protein